MYTSMYTYRLTAWLYCKQTRMQSCLTTYPMLLMVIAYTLVKLHGHGVRPVLFMWRPFHYFFARFRREWDLRTSIIDAFVYIFELFTVYRDSVGLYMYIRQCQYQILLVQNTFLMACMLALVIAALFMVLQNCLLILYSSCLPSYPFACYRKCLKKSN